MTDERDPDAELPSELASAYLDGEVTAEERATVEGDPALLAEVDRMRRLRDELADAPPAPAAARDAAIAAAMAVFDESPGNVVDLTARRQARWFQALSAAAAVAIVAAGAIVIATRDGNGSDSAVEDAAAPVTAAQEMSDAARVSQPAATEPEESADAVAPQTATELQAVPTTTTPAPAAAAPVVAPTTAPVAADEAETAAEPPPVLRDAADLAEFAEDLDTAPPPLDDVIDTCENARMAPHAVYLDDGGEEIEIVVARLDDGYAAVSLADCTVVLETES